MNQYYLTDTLSISKTDDPHPDRRYCIFVGGRVFHGTEQVARLLEVIATECDLDKIVKSMAMGCNSLTMDRDQVLAVVEKVLLPSGIISRAPDCLSKPLKQASYLFFSRTLISGRIVGRVAAPMSVLFARYMVFPTIMLCIFSISLWILGLLQAGNMSAALTDFDMSLPDSLFFYSLLMGSFIMHEFGHAAASHRFGSQPEEIGIGLYLIFPVLFCNVTQAWRLSRIGRLAVNLGGVYFQLIVCGIVALFQLVTRSDILTLVIYANLVSMLITLNPFLRFDGYWVYSDLFRLPNLRDNAREVITAAVTRVVRLLRGWPVVVTDAVSPALRLYAWTSMMFFSVFIVTILGALWAFASTAPGLWKAAIVKFDHQPALEAIVDTGGGAIMLAIYTLGCILTLGFISAALYDAMLVVRKACTRPVYPGETAKGRGVK